MNENAMTVIGNVCADLVARTTATGVDVTSFRLASTPRRFRNGVWEDGETAFFTVNCWRTLAKNVFASVHRGDPVVVQGLLRVRKWENQGVTGTSIEIDAQAVGFDLNRGSAVFSRAKREQSPLAAEAEAAGLRPDSAAGALAAQSAA